MIHFKIPLKSVKSSSKSVTSPSRKKPPNRLEHKSRSGSLKSKKNTNIHHKMAKVCLIVIDGWGVSIEQKGNAIANAQTPVMNKLAQEPGKYLTLDASGESVGLPAGLMGNSEVGHLNIGAGRVMYQDILRINKDCRSGVSAIATSQRTFIQCHTLMFINYILV